MNSQKKELVRYIVNGLVATAIHFFILSINLHVFEFESAGISNLIAAAFGIASSFLGSRYFVFRKAEQNILKQAIKFSGLYSFIAILHGVILYVWTDHYALDYRIGFLIATGMQVSLSYVGNKMLVFKS